MHVNSFIQNTIKKIDHHQQISLLGKSEETNRIPVGLKVNIPSNLPLPQHFLDLWKETEERASLELLQICKQYHKEEFSKAQQELSELKKVLSKDKVKELNAQIIHNQNQPQKKQLDHQQPKQYHTHQQQKRPNRQHPEKRHANQRNYNQPPAHKRRKQITYNENNYDYGYQNDFRNDYHYDNYQNKKQRQ